MKNYESFESQIMTIFAERHKNMKREFNDTGLCIPKKHFMVDTSSKIEQVIDLIDRGKYFTMNRPRQFGKTTMAFLLAETFKKRNDFLLIDLSFEVSEEDSFTDKKNVAHYFATLLHKALQRLKETTLASLVENQIPHLTGFTDLSQLITDLCKQAERKVVITIDEVDRASNNFLFMQFLALLRDKYLAQNRKADTSFQSVILVGVHDIKTLKRKIRPEESHSINSPWNIAVDFTVDMSFAPKEIETMLKQYCEDTQTQMNIPQIAERLYYYTSGYPYLVSKMCKIIDEKALRPPKGNSTPLEGLGEASSSGGWRTSWTLEDIEASLKYLVREDYSTTLFDDLSKNLTNNPDLYELVFQVAINGRKVRFNIKNPLLALAHTFGILKADERGFCVVHNRVFEKIIYDMMLSIQETNEMHNPLSFGQFESKGTLLLKDVLLKFQGFMQEGYAQKDANFLEREGRLLFLSFLKPILNGKGFDFKEPAVGDERRMDLVITYLRKKYVLELKIWRGEEYHQKGLEQLSDYLDLYQLKEGYLLIFDFRKTKEYKQEHIQFKDKSLWAVWI